MLSHCSQGKENSRPNMVRSLSVPLAPQQHDIPHFVLSAPAIPDKSPFYSYDFPINSNYLKIKCHVSHLVVSDSL